MRKAAFLLTCGAVSVLALQTVVWWGGVLFLEHRLANANIDTHASAQAMTPAGLDVHTGGGPDAAQSTRCSLVFQNRVRGGWPFRARVMLDGVQISCGGTADRAGLSYAVRHAVLELVPWHPLTVQGTLEGGQAFAVMQQDSAGHGAQGGVLLRVEGAPVRIALPLRVGPVGAVQFSTDFIHLLPQRGTAEAHPVTARGVRGKLVWNSQANTQASAVGLSFTAQSAVVAPWADRVDDVRGAVSMPGPAVRLSALWAPEGAGLLASADGSATPSAQGLPSLQSSVANGASGYAEILVQHLAGRWRGLGFSWSGRLVMAPGGAPLGETWLTLSDWRPFLAHLQQDKTLRPEQTVLLSRLTDQLEQRTGGIEGPLSVPLQVRDGAVQLAGVPLLSVLATLRGVSVSGAEPLKVDRGDP
ncbi:DUF2125 domain-containing protein [Acetobacter orleanensis]|uniref:DUF2125 domain-containing protein n=1 Tax=Acetobacter orleanensis TaxID=104099 RepID=A0A4Y3TJT1_9PROT|nr:DUF2125 domain-containing protein [Acetobacter orleanensis]KXV62842.1 hypothetical protein AD949_08780 [Acetobacter orleanensis]PCD80619.1 DUF2125 domain-containing protein [Acetobacter orleanensis]GAN68049.1 hypothetical protein Abol_014_100 [Acetobacter orleanensis JCM 7639]GBR27224.1 hypothetical protein AA0473_1373 [Acetobacter orleanensis NRIC 0473]GEB82028.1 hypothetical protein AOR01nite_05050 [Acetobacter orleanensis]